MPRRLPVIALALTLFSFAPIARAAGIQPVDGDLYTLASPIASPPIDRFSLLRVRMSGLGVGTVDTVVTLPTGNGPVDMDCSPTSGLIYVLAKTSIYRVDPCTGAIATVTTGG